MPFDSAMLSAVLQDLNHQLLYGRVQQVFQSAGQRLLLLVRKPGRTYTLLLCSDPQFARLHLVEESPQKLPTPPPFCMLLRKHLTGARLVRVAQPLWERIAEFTFEGFDEAGRQRNVVLVAEVMGRHSNIILYRQTDRQIVGAVRHVSSEVNRYREILPGAEYIPPPPQEKRPPGEVNEALLSDLASKTPQRTMWRVLLAGIAGLSPQAAQSLLRRCGALTDIRAEETAPHFRCIAEKLQEYARLVAEGDFRLYLQIDKQGRASDVYAYDPGLAAEQLRPYTNVHRLLEDFFSTQEENRSVKAKRTSLLKTVQAAIARAQRKLGSQEEELAKAQQAPEFKKRADLLMANLHRLERGTSSAVVVDYYDPDQPELEIPLDPRRSPAENAQEYYQRYQKARTAQKVVAKNINSTKAEINYLMNVEGALELAETLPDLDEIEEELRREGYLQARRSRPGKDRKKEGERRESSPLRFESPDGFTVLVGKNNRQNDLITMRLARPDDIWLHVKDIPGAHVLIRTDSGSQVPKTTLHFAARLAAYYSKARQSENVPVDYTRVRHVRKPGGARPGFFIYDNQKTLYVSPENATCHTATT